MRNAYTNHATQLAHIATYGRGLRLCSTAVGPLCVSTRRATVLESDSNSPICHNNACGYLLRNQRATWLLLTPSCRCCRTPFTALRGLANNIQATMTPSAGATCFIMMLSDAIVLCKLLTGTLEEGDCGCCSVVAFCCVAVPRP